MDLDASRMIFQFLLALLYCSSLWHRLQFLGLAKKARRSRRFETSASFASPHRPIRLHDERWISVITSTTQRETTYDIDLLPSLT
ncbi:uncharacterized protein GGS22DRAFT_101790 [Annulohypoxylon maeteangense]|uniref:uncharacterized protein n=1 Tax=Annulohypoxylon maeteangense TaxID=1927788 RepID=UPI002008521D|nr:uncharacterized protein GGS22DRAFT_101790 [Annulohypoxylon maeteangense]KAI0879950.1 hypothetical protein GGS22DRAFT_101790 [Annulohypoxylon maeteangense]